MAATREELEKRMRITDDVFLLSLDENPPHNSSVLSPNSSSALELRQQAIIKTLDTVISTVISASTAEAEIKEDLSSYTKSNDTIKEILLPIPSLAGITNVKDLQENSTLIDHLPHELQEICLSYEEDIKDDHENTKQSNKKLSYHRTSFFSHLLAQIRLTLFAGAAIN